MNLLLHLFSLYVLLLACIPCQADDECCMEEVVANAAHRQPLQKGDRPGYPAPCSPFFACGASHGFIIPDFPIAAVPEIAAKSTNQPFYKGQPLPEFPSAIWQPPQLS